MKIPDCPWREYRGGDPTAVLHTALDVADEAVDNSDTLDDAE